MRRLLRSQDGWSLIEIASVLIIVGVVAVVAVPNFRRSLDRAQTDRVPIELESDLRLALSTAKAQGRAMRIVFGPSGYEVQDAADSNLVVQARDWAGHADFTVSGNPLIFPWGLVQPTDITLEGPHGEQVMLSVLPTGKLQHTAAE